MDDFKENIKAAREAALLNDYDTSLIYYQVSRFNFSKVTHYDAP